MSSVTSPAAQTPSMAVAGLLTEMEDRFGILIEDDDIDGETFETFGTLLAFARAKVGN
jgi:acyl carrier protein